MRKKLKGFKEEGGIVGEDGELNYNSNGEETVNPNENGGGVSSTSTAAITTNTTHLKKKRYIHDFMTQEQLLKEAVFTEFVNRKQLEDLLRLEEEKK